MTENENVVRWTIKALRDGFPIILTLCVVCLLVILGAAWIAHLGGESYIALFPDPLHEAMYGEEDRPVVNGEILGTRWELISTEKVPDPEDLEGPLLIRRVYEARSR